MPKNKQNNIDKVYNRGFLGRAHKKLDSFRLRRLPKYRNIVGRLPAIDKAYEVERAEKAARYGRKVPCPLCEDIENRHVEFETKHMLVMVNDYPYYMYDGAMVKKHLMLVPRRHVQSLSDLDAKEQAEYWKFYVKLSDMGYNTMTRPTGNHRRSVPGHVHTHLISLHNY